MDLRSLRDALEVDVQHLQRATDASGTSRSRTCCFSPSTVQRQDRRVKRFMLEVLRELLVIELDVLRRLVRRRRGSPGTRPLWRRRRLAPFLALPRGVAVTSIAMVILQVNTSSATR